MGALGKKVAYDVNGAYTPEAVPVTVIKKRPGITDALAFLSLIDEGEEVNQSPPDSETGWFSSDTMREKIQSYLVFLDPFISILLTILFQEILQRFGLQFRRGAQNQARGAQALEEEYQLQER